MSGRRAPLGARRSAASVALLIAALTWRGADVRATFVASLVFIVGGLVYLFTIGFLQR